jgi:hypothetical protein
MTTDDRDIESSNPASFKVGEADHLSGFFTPVWESKRRLRAESPIPASSAAASAPISSRGAGQGPPSQDAVNHASAGAARVARAGAGSPSSGKGSASEPPVSPEAHAPAVAGSARSAPAGARHPSSPPVAVAAPERISSPAASRGAAPQAAAASSSAPLPAATAAEQTSARAAKPASKAAPPRATRSSGPPRASKGAAKSAAKSPTKNAATTGAVSKSSAAQAEPAPAAARESLPPPAPVDSLAPRTQRQGLLEASSEPPQVQPSDDAKVTPLAPSVSELGATPAIPPVAELAAAPAETITPAPPADLSAHPVAAALAAAAAAPATLRPVIPMPLSPGRLPPRTKPPSGPPSAAAEALRRAGPNLDADAFIDREPDFRAPAGNPARAASADVQRSARAVSAAAAVHGKLRTKLLVESDEVFGRHRETESEREALQAAAARAAAGPVDPYPGQVLRTLRRTIHLSTPLPEDVRQMLAKYR